MSIGENLGASHVDHNEYLQYEAFCQSKVASPELAIISTAPLNQGLVKTAEALQARMSRYPDPHSGQFPARCSNFVLLDQRPSSVSLPLVGSALRHWSDQKMEKVRDR